MKIITYIYCYISIFSYISDKNMKKMYIIAIIPLKQYINSIKPGAV
jgi:hypothetical protein